jgi:hypothetical protein
MMNKLASLLLLTIFLFGCAEKTHNLIASKSSKDIKTYMDSTNQKKTEIIDKSTITTNRDIDTSIIITGKALTGYINKLDTTMVHFENGDISLDLQTNKTTGLIKATATPKLRKAALRIHERTTVNNDIQTIADVRSNLKSKSDIKTDSAVKQVTDHTVPGVVKKFKVVFIVILLILIIAGVIVYLIKKYSVTGMITGWIKNLF